MVAEWMNIPILDVYELDYRVYLQMRKDAFISAMNKTESGREYLDKAWLLEQTSPDKEASRKMFGGE